MEKLNIDILGISELKVMWSESHSVVSDSLRPTMDYTIREILQARILEWVVFPFSRGSSQLRDQTQVSYIAGGFFTNWAIRETPNPCGWANLIQMTIITTTVGKNPLEEME